MNIKQLDEIFSYIDLTTKEIQVYMALLQKKKCSPAEVAKISGLNRTKVYDQLASLEKKGACILLQANQRTYEPVDPRLLMEKVRKRFSVVNASISEVSDELNKMYDDPCDANDTVDYVEVMSDPILIFKKFNNLIELAKEEILISSAGESVMAKLGKKDKELARHLNIESDKLLTNALKRNVLFQVCIGLNDLNLGIFDELYWKLLEYDNYDIRVIENIPCKLALFDGEHIAIGLRGIRTGKYVSNTIYLKDKGLGSSLRRSFYSYWKEGISFREIDIDVLANERKIESTLKSIIVK